MNKTSNRGDFIRGGHYPPSLPMTPTNRSPSRRR